MNQRRLPRAAVPSLVTALAVLAGLLIVPSSHIAEADTDVNSGASMSSVNFIGYVARNIIVGNTIEVCTDDYPNATAEAVRMWNNQLQHHTPPFLAPDTSVFAIVAQCEQDPDSEHIEYIEVDSRHPTDSAFFCRPPPRSPNGCFLFPPPRTRSPHSTWIGNMLVTMNEEKRPRAHDSYNMPTPLADPNNYEDHYFPVLRTLAHELGHAVGLGDHPCPSPVTVDSLMYCSGYSTAYPLRDRDFTDYAAIYKPNVVKPRQSLPLVANVDQPDQPGTIVFNFDASSVVVEEEIQIWRWNALANAWQLLQTFAPESGLITWIAHGQPTGMQKYRIFSTTQALIDGQCFIDDEECIDSGRVAGERIGFGTAALTVDIPAPPIIPQPAKYTLDVQVTGLGHVDQVPVGPDYDAGDEVTLTAVPTPDTEDMATDWVHETTTLSMFGGWYVRHLGEDADESEEVICSETDLTCVLIMDENKVVRAPFTPIV